MAKVLIIDVDGKDYRFGLDRNEIRRGEKKGLRLKDFEDMPIDQITTLWEVGLHKYQPKLTEVQCEALYDKYLEEDGDLMEVIEFLMKEYAHFVPTLQTDTPKVKKARYEEI